jgi:zinc/manganese transport system substrate-binding protein
MNINSINVFNKKAFLFYLILAAIYTARPAQCQAADKLKVVTTTTNLASIAKSVGGDYVDVSAISTGREDPHFIEAKPSYMLKAKNADLWIRVGLELEIGYEGLILEGSRNTKIYVGSQGHLDVSEGIIPLEVPTQSMKIDRSMGDVHPLGNPHYWLDPNNGRIIAQNICRRLKELDPAHASDYDRNLTAFLSKLDKAMAGWSAKLKPYEHSKIVTYHRSWTYFAHRFNLDVVAELESKPGIPPGPAHILDVINSMKSDNVKLILMEPFYNQRDADAVAKKTNAKVVVAATAVNGQKEAADYITMLDNIVTRLNNALSEVLK